MKHLQSLLFEYFKPRIVYIHAVFFATSALPCFFECYRHPLSVSRIAWTHRTHAHWKQTGYLWPPSMRVLKCNACNNFCAFCFSTNFYNGLSVFDFLQSLNWQVSASSLHPSTFPAWSICVWTPTMSHIAACPLTMSTACALLQISCLNKDPPQNPWPFHDPLICSSAQSLLDLNVIVSLLSKYSHVFAHK